ncbi:methylglutaconyl-CoA hydratase [Plasticicumulans lactativorans]|uniref:Methylglutaconyl-CoA hydratase n=1 Tax=Plasticicumulans lactativorans TaxID=1133106 RepID=A0A4R2L5H4_9GAMM|nr:enoyl-CoA hydratase/isomerase family protein [Plasticicumulans lactativorans]TCO79279.1 methylglutaconyl-CoA hydratase [Plasticicumulans lactativorans]
MSAIQIETAAGVATLTLNRPELHNAFDDALIAALTAALRRLEADPAVRVVVLAANGKSFSAGADLNWMRRMADYTVAQNLDDARGLAELMRTLNALAKPTVAKVQGAAYGGGVGLVACCDIAVAADGASFCLSEVRLGLIPAVISPYVVNAIGERQARRYFVSAERFDAAEARRIGLVHEVVPAAGLDAKVDELLATLAGNGPAAMVAAKDLARAVARGPLDAAMIEDTARRIADIRASAEGREGLSAFLGKRRPAWTERSA